MAGLLYKDFVAVKGKWYVLGILAVIAGMFAVRVTIPGLGTEFARGVDMILPALCMVFTVILFFVVVTRLEVSVVSVDEGKKQKHYFLSLPVSLKQYVASKYIFILLAFYIIIAVSMILGGICLIDCREEEMMKYFNQWLSMVPLLAGVLLIIPSIELPFFIGFGAQKGGQIKTVLLIVLFFLGIVYMLFGDLTIFDEFAIVAVLDYLDRHKGLVLFCYALLPYVSLGLYYLSYRISCLLFARKEWEND